MRTIDERPHKEGNNINDSKSNLSEVEAERPDSECCSEGQHPVGVHDGEGESPKRECASDYATIHLDVYRFFPARE